MPLTSDPQPPPARRAQIVPLTAWRGSELAPRTYLIDVRDLRIADRAIDALAACTDTPAEVRTMQPAVERVSDLLARHSAAFVDLASEVRERLERRSRFVVLRRFGFQRLPDSLRDALVLGFCNLVGRPTAGDRADGRLVRDVKPSIAGGDPSAARDETELHTDTPHRASPERYVSFWCVRPADEGGATRLVDARTVAAVMGGSSDGTRHVATLRQTALPFRPPRSLETDQPESRAVTREPILSDAPFIRYAGRPLSDGLRAAAERITTPTQRAVEAFERALRTPGLPLTVLLGAGDAVFVNNHELLHAQNDSADARRHLLRVGMDVVPND